jgi:hypothetical protein
MLTSHVDTGMIEAWTWQSQDGHVEETIDIFVPLLHGPQRSHGTWGLRSNSLATDNAPLGATLNGALDDCTGVCCCIACIAAAPGAGW